MNKVLVTGGSGFIGRHLVNKLIEKNVEVRVLLRDPKQCAAFPATVETFIGDLTKPYSINKVCEGIHTVYHLAGFAHAFTEHHSNFAEKHHQTNFLGTSHLIEEIIKSNAQSIVYFSSVKAVGDSQQCIDESFDVAPSTPYGQTKRSAEKLIIDMSKRYHFHACILRPALVYGPKWKGNLASMLKAIDKKIFPPLPNINNRRSMIGIDDLCEAAILVATHPTANGKIYFVTDGKNYSTKEIYLSMLEALGKAQPFISLPYVCFLSLAKIGDVLSKLTGKRMPIDSQSLDKLFGSAEYSAKRIRDELGFVARMNFRNMLPTIVAVYKQESIKEHRYANKQ